MQDRVDIDRHIRLEAPYLHPARPVYLLCSSFASRYVLPTTPSTAASAGTRGQQRRRKVAGIGFPRTARRSRDPEWFARRWHEPRATYETHVHFTWIQRHLQRTLVEES